MHLGTLLRQYWLSRQRVGTLHLRCRMGRQKGSDGQGYASKNQVT
jgi:hypothetical protein